MTLALPPLDDFPILNGPSTIARHPVAKRALNEGLAAAHACFYVFYAPVIDSSRTLIGMSGGWGLFKNSVGLLGLV